MRTYLFFQERMDDDGVIYEVWYPLGLDDDAMAIANAKCNPGTIRVQNVDGKVIWSAK